METQRSHHRVTPRGVVFDTTMSSRAFVLTYTKTKTQPPAQAIEYEKTFSTMWSALDFCIRLADLEGEPLAIVRYLDSREDGVLEGPALAEAIHRQRVLIASI